MGSVTPRDFAAMGTVLFIAAGVVGAMAHPRAPVVAGALLFAAASQYVAQTGWWMTSRGLAYGGAAVMLAGLALL